MDFFRRADKRQVPFEYARILVLDDATASVITRWTCWLTDATSPAAPKLTVCGAWSNNGPRPWDGSENSSSGSNVRGAKLSVSGSVTGSMSSGSRRGNPSSP